MKTFVLVASLGLVGGCGSDSEAPNGAPDASVGQPKLVAEPSMYDFGPVAVGIKSAPATFTLRNRGKTAAKTLHFDAPDELGVDAGTCTGSLDAGKSCSFTMTFSPAHVGDFMSTVSIQGGGDEGASVNVHASGQSPNQLALTTTEHNFGALVVGAANPTYRFEVHNYALATTGPVAVTINGPQASSFSQTTSCTTLAPDADCFVDVTALSVTAGLKTATLEVRGMPGGVAMAMLSANLLTPAELTVSSVPDAQFGDVVVNNSAERTFVVANSGTQPSGQLAINLTGLDFTLLTGSPDDCIGGTTSLTLGTTCNVRVRFKPTTPGGRTAGLTVSASPGGVREISISGNGLAAGQLWSGEATHTFEATEVQALSSTFEWTVKNIGNTATGTPSLTNNNGTKVSIVSNTCTTALAPGATCAITMKFRPIAGGMNDANLTITASPGGAASLALKSEGLWRLTVTTVGNGAVTSNGISCGNGQNNCSALFAQGSVVTLNARPENGSGRQFAGWSGACVGLVNDCTVTMTAQRSTTAQFTNAANNIAFVSSTKVTGDRGVAAYDNECNTLATAAGINNASGSAFKAWISGDSKGAAARIGDNGGWRMLDQRIFARSMNDLVQNRVLNGLAITEKGETMTGETAWTSTSPNGYLANQNCNNWSDPQAYGRVGVVGGGPGQWTWTTEIADCGVSRRLYCLQTTPSNPIAAALPPPNAKITYYADGFTPGGGSIAADIFCNAHKPALYATRSFRALVATSTKRISNIVTSGNYYRPDGTFVGTASNINNGVLVSGIWQRDDGTYPAELVRAWTGATATNEYGTVTSSCNDWTYSDPGATGTEAPVNQLDYPFWRTSTPALSCNSTRALLCVEQ